MEWTRFCIKIFTHCFLTLIILHEENLLKICNYMELLCVWEKHFPRNIINTNYQLLAIRWKIVIFSRKFTTFTFSPWEILLQNIVPFQAYEADSFWLIPNHWFDEHFHLIQELLPRNLFSFIFFFRKFYLSLEKWKFKTKFSWINIDEFKKFR